MALWAKVNALISGIPDNRVRLDVATTINFLYSVYCDGGINEDQLRGELVSICMDVIGMSNPMLSPEDIRDRAEMAADDLVKAMKIEALVRRVRARYGPMIR